MNASSSALTRADLFAWGISAVALALVIHLHLLSALLAGLLVFELVDVLTPWLRSRALGRDGPRLLAVTLIATVVIAVLASGVLALIGFLRNSGESLPLLMQKMAQIIEDARGRLPSDLLAYVPEDAETLRQTIVNWLRQHAGSLQLAGRDFGRSLVHILMGMIVGALLSLQKAAQKAEQRPLAERVTRQAENLAAAFRRVVFAQFWISTINTFFTWLYLGVALPAFGVDLPLSKTLVAITFIAGLLPILGNLISNAAIIVVSLSHGLPVALASFVYLVVIHKLEYFLNARIIGSNINARAWELLIAMLVMEAAFGIPGLIAAPIFYAYFKEELRSRALV
ncbi:AI-2E family transporter [Solimonas soli]|uniref:AI-2E family transporter n=1 Tax=Solimonas soli TaxID=413479 RepID=UPI00047F4753|nr:AI-2E family transporter [Solimonas soli]